MGYSRDDMMAVFNCTLELLREQNLNLTDLDKDAMETWFGIVMSRVKERRQATKPPSETPHEKQYKAWVKAGSPKEGFGDGTVPFPQLYDNEEEPK
jgi:hypothetical protein